MQIHVSLETINSYIRYSLSLSNPTLVLDKKRFKILQTVIDLVKSVKHNVNQVSWINKQSSKISFKGLGRARDTTLSQALSQGAKQCTVLRRLHCKELHFGLSIIELAAGIQEAHLNEFCLVFSNCMRALFPLSLHDRCTTPR